MGTKISRSSKRSVIELNMKTPINGMPRREGRYEK